MIASATDASNPARAEEEPATPARRSSILFLDIDGVLLPFGADRQGAPGDTLEGRLARLNLATGRRLAALPCQLVWATAWEHDANVEVAPQLGLPRLPVVTWPEPSGERDREDDWLGLHWKTRPLVDWAAGRPFAWIDDEITGADRDWVSVHHPGRALLHHVESWRGLAAEDLEVLDAWLREG